MQILAQQLCTRHAVHHRYGAAARILDIMAYITASPKGARLRLVTGVLHASETVNHLQELHKPGLPLAA